MNTALIDQIVQLAEKLTPIERMVLIQRLEPDEAPLTREQAIAELEMLRAAGAFDQVESMRGKYARPDLNISDDELNTYLREIGREWEQDIDQLIG